MGPGGQNGNKVFQLRVCDGEPCDAGLTPKEISGLRRFSVQTYDGLVGDHISLAGKKGKYLKPRRIPLAPNGRLKRALIEVLESFPGSPNDPLIVSERALFGDREGDLPGISVYQEMRPTSIGYVLWKLADTAKVSMDGGRDARRTFIVRAGRTMKQVGGTARDVQALAGHGFSCLRKVSGGHFPLASL